MSLLEQRTGYARLPSNNDCGEVRLDLAAESFDVPTKAGDSVISAALETRHLRLGHVCGPRQLALRDVEILTKLLQRELSDLFVRARPKRGRVPGEKTCEGPASEPVRR
jgi:hypothetical protein